MKLRHVYTTEPSLPSGWQTDEWKITYTKKDDISKVLQEMIKVVDDYRQKYSGVEISVSVDSCYHTSGFSINCSRKLTDTEQTTLKQEIKNHKEQYKDAHKKHIRKEAKKLGLL